MFVYLSKKIAIPNGVKLRSVAWNGDQGWIACGGDNGLLKVLKLDMDRNKTTSSLSMNQTLDGHEGSICVVGWNEQYRKLTSADSNGLIIVWMLHKGMWFEEMINNRNRSIVRDQRWTYDGQKVCIAYEDGAVIVGSVDGNRLWGKELRGAGPAGKPLHLTHCVWSPDAKNLLFGTIQGEVHIYDAITGNYMQKVQGFCIEDSPGVKLCGLEWYDNADQISEGQPTLAICYENGRCQLMRTEMDDKPTLIDTGMKTTKIKWNQQGQVLAIGGTQSATGAAGEKKDVSMVQFYNAQGQHLRTLKVPGSGIASLSWEGNGLRLALAVDSFIYFANVRPDYKWGFFNKTLVYSFTKPGRGDHCIVFWNTETAEKYVKYVKRLLFLATAGDNCVLVKKTDDASGQHIVILCNAIGSPVDSKYLDFEPVTVSMTKTHVVTASDDMVHVWQFRAVTGKDDKSAELDPQAAVARRKETKERTFNVEDPSAGEEQGRSVFKRGTGSTNDQICAAAVSDQFVLIGRESGTVQMYALPQIRLVNKFTMSCRPQTMAINCTSTRLSVIDIHGVLGFYVMPPRESWSMTPSEGKSLAFERKDVWDMCWAVDNEELFAMMEKTRMYIFRGLDPEEPIVSSANICEFSDLKIKAVVLDEVMAEPEHPQKDCMVSFETKSLRDTRELLSTKPTPAEQKEAFRDAYEFIDKHPHPRLWSLLAEHALDHQDFVVAEKAFVRCRDYQGIQFVKRLKHLEGDVQKQKAEIAAHFLRFDEAEKIYKEIDRKDLAAELRKRLGDWFKVVQLVQEGGLDEVQIQEAWNNIGDYYADRQKWAKAVQYYSQAKNYGKLVEFYYILEDYKNLIKLIDTLPEGDELLTVVGQKFASVGMSKYAVESFLKAAGRDQPQPERVKLAVDACIELNHWHEAVRLAEEHRLPEVGTYLAKYATHLVDKGEVTKAIELYKKAEYHTDAARLLARLGREAGAQQNPLRAKKFFFLAAYEVDRFKERTFDQKSGAVGLDAMLKADRMTSADRSLDNPWRGCEAYHFFMLAQQQLIDAHRPDMALNTAMRLMEYDDILDEVDLHSLIALVAYYNKNYAVCSKAFIRLEAIEARGGSRGDPNGTGKSSADSGQAKVEEEAEVFTSLDMKGSINIMSAVGQLTKKATAGPVGAVFDFDDTPRPFQDLAIKIFKAHLPRDTSESVDACTCGTKARPWHTQCEGCSKPFGFCVASGRLIPPTIGSEKRTVVSCPRCRHRAYSAELLQGKSKVRHCPLCHASYGTALDY
eukprot:Hpha_TRINITY_DN8695_c0_g1::TRINITY_DN8695_c0_g1_i1::g.168905::m.168905/K19674/WDR35, IFT121; WD repeat-containing protein 35